MVFDVTMATFWMTLLMNKRTYVVIDDGRVHPLGKTLPSLVISDEMLSLMIEIWMKNSLFSDSNCDTVNL